MDILNFISWIKGKRVVTSVDPAKTLIPVGLKDPRRDDAYLAGAITVDNFITEMNMQTNISAGNFRLIGCINEDIVLPENSNLTYPSPLTMCVGKTLTVPVGTTLTVV
jgi:hypothetical protein